MSVSTLVQLVHNPLQKFATKIPVEVRESVTDLGYPENGAKGMTVGGTIYLFRDRLGSLADARDMLFHELFHFGVRRFLPREQYTNTMINLSRHAAPAQHGQRGRYPVRHIHQCYAFGVQQEQRCPVPWEIGS